MHALPLSSIFTKLKSMWRADRLMRPTVTNDGAIHLRREVQQNTTIIWDNGQCEVTTGGRATVKHMSKTRKKLQFHTEKRYFHAVHLVRYIFLYAILELMPMTAVKQWRGFRHVPKRTTLKIASLIFRKSQDIFSLVVSNSLPCNFTLNYAGTGILI
jgi:hypothetical protein